VASFPLVLKNRIAAYQGSLFSEDARTSVGGTVNGSAREVDWM